MRATGNLAGVTFLSPPRYHRDQEQWQQIITESGYFFTVDAMRWFSSRILWDTLAPIGNDYLFVSSEQDTYTSQPRAYSVRVWTMDGGVDTIGALGGHTTRAAALKALREVLQAQQARAN
jgi:hypothetical protein